MSRQFPPFGPFDDPITRLLRESESALKQFEDVMNPPGLQYLTDQIHGAQSLGGSGRHRDLFDEAPRQHTLALEVEKMQLLYDPISNVLGERMAREHALLSQINELSSVQSLRDHITGLDRTPLDLAAEQAGIRQAFLDQIDGVGGFAGLARQIAADLDNGALSRADRIALSAREDIRAARNLFGKSVFEALDHRSELLRAMDAIRSPEQTLASLAVASISFDELRAPDSFAAVGAASFAASDLFARRQLLSDEFNSHVDRFFGDWSRIEQLPTAYPTDPGARREVIEEIEADEDLLDVDADEAASIIEESLITQDGVPVLVLGRPTGFVLVKDPGEATYALLARFERKIRGKVVAVMTAKFGENWIEEKCSDLLPEWRSKREDEIRANLEPCPLIDYSTLSELTEIVTRYWTDGFAIDGKKARVISQPLHALTPLRNRTFHARPVTSEILFGVINNVRKIEPWLRSLTHKSRMRMRAEAS